MPNTVRKRFGPALSNASGRIKKMPLKPHIIGVKSGSDLKLSQRLCIMWGIVGMIWMCPFSWKGKNPWLQSLAYIKDWRVALIQTCTIVYLR